MVYDKRFGIKYKYDLDQVVVLNASGYKKSYIDKFNDYAVITNLCRNNRFGILGPAYEITFNNGDRWFVSEDEIDPLKCKET